MNLNQLNENSETENHLETKKQKFIIINERMTFVTWKLYKN